MTTPASPAAVGSPLPGHLAAIVRSRTGGAAVADLPVRWLAETDTRVDTGGWLGGAPLTAAVVGESLVLVADGPRPFARVVPATALRQGVYNHVTGELAFFTQAPGGPAAEIAPGVHGLRIGPLAARALADLAPA